MSLRDAKTQRVLIAACICGGAAWAYFLAGFVPFGYQAHARKSKELRTKHEALSAELEKARRTVGNLPQLEREQRDLERKWQQAESLLPTSKEMPVLLSQITQAGEQAGVEFQVFRPDASLPQEFYNENPVSIEVKGGFHQVGVFLSRLANMSRIVNVANLSLEGSETKARSKGDKGSRKKRGEEDGERTDHTLTASFTATAYSLRDPNEPAPEQAPPAEKGATRNARKASGAKNQTKDAPKTKNAPTQGEH